MLISHCIIKQRTGLGRPRSLTCIHWFLMRSSVICCFFSRLSKPPGPPAMMAAAAAAVGRISADIPLRSSSSGPRATIASGIDDRPISGEKDFDFFPAFTVQLQLFTFYSFNGRGARRAIKSRLCASPLNFCRMKSTRRLLCHATRQRQQQSAIARRLRAFVRL